MSNTIVAHFDGMHFVPDEPVVGLAPGDRVEVMRVPDPDASLNEDPLMQIINFAVDTGIPDLAENADHYLYGHPKPTEEVDDQ